jgi:hypothetical protein
MLNRHTRMDQNSDALLHELLATPIGRRAESFDAAQDAIPLIGEILAVVEEAADLATLAEAIADTITTPWVIENEVNLSYTTTLTIQKDPTAATFPTEASTFTVQAIRGLRKVDTDGTISSVGFTPGAYTVRDVVGDGSGNRQSPVQRSQSCR